MQLDAQTVLASIWGYAAAFAVVVVGLSGWLGRVAAERIATRERARIESESRAHQDVLARRRDVYAALSKAMRVFIARSGPTTLEEKKAFLEAYDVGFLWASEEVAATLSSFVDLMQRSTAAPGAVSNEHFRDAYTACLTAMRRDAGFGDTTARYRIVNF
jgi:hypothetical protein